MRIQRKSKGAEASSESAEKSRFPMRINKYLASKKYATRRGADELVEKKVVFINGQLAKLGDKISEKDKVEVRQKIKTKEYSYFAYNKPQGIVTHSPQMEEKDIEHSVNIKGKYVFPIGRLDKDSHGLIILTDDGRITDLLLNPIYVHDKEYVVTTKGRLRSSFKNKMETGVNIGDYVTKPCKVKILGENKFSVTLTEGKKHQIRRMCSALFQEVEDLERIRILNIKLGTLKRNAHREIVEGELKEFLTAIGM